MVEKIVFRAGLKGVGDLMFGSVGGSFTQAIVLFPISIFRPVRGRGDRIGSYGGAWRATGLQEDNNPTGNCGSVGEG